MTFESGRCSNAPATATGPREAGNDQGLREISQVRMVGSIQADFLRVVEGESNTTEYRRVVVAAVEEVMVLSFFFFVTARGLDVARLGRLVGAMRCILKVGGILK